MSDPVLLAVAVPAAVLGAAGFGLASAAQQRATHEVAVTPTLSPRLLLDLARRPWWLIGLLATVVALVLQLVALTFGPLAVVQPLLVTGAAFAGTFAALLHRRAPDRYLVLGALCTGAGLAVFLLLARPTAPPGPERVDLADAPWFVVALVAVVVAALAFAGLSSHPARVLALALATGVLFGLTAALMKVITGAIGQGVGAVLTLPELYAACVIGPLGFLLSQNTFQQGRLVSPAVAVITTVDPVVSVFAGIAWLGESLVTTPGLLAGEVVGGVVVVAGIALVTLRGRALLRSGTAPEDAGLDAGPGARPDTAPRTP